MFRQTLANLRIRPSSSYSFACRSSLSRYLPRPNPQIQVRPFSSSPIRPAVYDRFSSSGPRPTLGPRRELINIGLALLGVGGIFYLFNLEKVPETGRWRFMVISPKYDAKLGEMMGRQIREEFKDAMISPDHLLSRHIRRVVSRILAASNLGVVRGEDTPFSYTGSPDGGVGGDAWNPDAELDRSGKQEPEREWEVMVVNDPKMVNAQVVPGLIVVYTGILPICQDEQGLAAVLAHEIGHVVARHTAERLSSQTVTFALIFILALFGVDFGITDFVQNLVLELPNSRTQELEADKIGLSLMARACFDPRAAPDMFVRLGHIEKQIAGRAGFEFLQTHPSSSKRVQKLEEILPEAYAVLAASPDCGAIQDELQLFRAAAEVHGPGLKAGVGEGGTEDAEMF